jgi:Domain of unknown function (DUF5615)
MLPLLADENFKGSVVRGLLLREPALDLVRVQDVGLSVANDPAILEWAANSGRLLLTHDYQTVPKHAWERVAAGRRMPGVIVADTYVPVHQAIDDILLLAVCSSAEEASGQVIYLPL